ncbi:hypothetical protein AMTRI_Chr11g153620 [Amborella trichopoda]
MLLPRSQLVPCPLSFSLLTPLSHHRQPPSSSTIIAATFFLNHHSSHLLPQPANVAPPSATSHQTTVSSATLQLATAYLPLPALRVSLPPISTINFYHHLCCNLLPLPYLLPSTHSSSFQPPPFPSSSFAAASTSPSSLYLLPRPSPLSPILCNLLLSLSL